MNRFEGYSVAAPHIHTEEDDGLSSLEEIIKKAAETNISVLVFCLHDKIIGMVKAKKIGQDYGVGIISGEEITTGIVPPNHIIGINLSESIKPFLGTEQTIKKIREQEALVILPHPGIGNRKKRVKKFLEDGLLDGIEINYGNHKYLSFGEANKSPLLKDVALIGSPDSHHGRYDLDTSLTLFPGKTTEDFMEAIRNRTTIPIFIHSAEIPKIDCARQLVKAIGIGIERYIDYREEALENLKGSIREKVANGLKIPKEIYSVRSLH